ncbi:hypothetical protein [Deinococcus misasensis]|uniref:hypothetical protein n=1 Tax=Deinococcus misasensis TaxID=392413 RepID=UPI00055824C1|nr:hypothetical protein [Deinococcus misasensis]
MPEYTTIDGLADALLAKKAVEVPWPDRIPKTTRLLESRKVMGSTRKLRAFETDSGTTYLFNDGRKRHAFQFT